MDEKEEKEETKKSIKQEQIQDILFNKEIGWQEIIYDLINTEQLDPWDIDIIILSEKYLEKIRELEEADFFISSKVLLAASLLLRIKSEILLNKYIKSIDEILLGKKEDKKTEFEKIEIEDEIPELIPKSPLPRFRKVTLKELIESLNKAIKTENRRIKRTLIHKNALRESGISLPKTKISIKDKIKMIHKKIIEYFKKNENENKIPYTKFIGKTKKEKIETFFPLLQLENNKKIWLEQEKHFEEIFIWHHKKFFEKNPDFIKELNDLIDKKEK